MVSYRRHERFATPRMAALTFEMRRNRVRKLLAKADDADLVEAAWILDWGREKGFKLPKGYDFPEDCLQADIPNPKRIHSWEIETLLTEALAIPKRRNQRHANTRSWNFFAEAINA